MRDHAKLKVFGKPNSKSQTLRSGLETVSYGNEIINQSNMVVKSF